MPFRTSFQYACRDSAWLHMDKEKRSLAVSIWDLLFHRSCHHVSLKSVTSFCLFWSTCKVTACSEQDGDIRLRFIVQYSLRYWRNVMDPKGGRWFTLLPSLESQWEQNLFASHLSFNAFFTCCLWDVLSSENFCYFSAHLNQVIPNPHSNCCIWGCIQFQITLFFSLSCSVLMAFLSIIPYMDNIPVNKSS